MTAKDEIFNWLKFAIEDLKAAKSFLSKEELMPRHACWLAQQATEKDAIIATTDAEKIVNKIKTIINTLNT